MVKLWKLLSWSFQCPIQVYLYICALVEQKWVTEMTHCSAVEPD